jgi:hypothetical protein
MPACGVVGQPCDNGSCASAAGLACASNPYAFVEICEAACGLGGSCFENGTCAPGLTCLTAASVLSCDDVGYWDQSTCCVALGGEGQPSACNYDYCTESGGPNQPCNADSTCDDDDDDELQCFAYDWGCAELYSLPDLETCCVVSDPEFT